MKLNYQVLKQRKNLITQKKIFRLFLKRKKEEFKNNKIKKYNKTKKRTNCSRIYKNKKSLNFLE